MGTLISGQYRMYERILKEKESGPVRPKETGEVKVMRALIERGVHSPGTGMRLRNLRKKYPDAYYRITSEKMGQVRLTDG